MVVINAKLLKKTEWLNAVASKKVIIDLDNPQITVDIVPTIRNLKDASVGKDQKVDIALTSTFFKNLAKLVTKQPKLQERMAKLAKATFIEAKLQDIEIIISRSGYTGEEWGFELYVHPEDASKLWQILMEQGKEFGIQAAGLGARDSTRTEVGFYLYGHELVGELNITLGKLVTALLSNTTNHFLLAKQDF